MSTTTMSHFTAEMLKEAKYLRPRSRPNTWGRGRDRDHNLEAEVETKAKFNRPSPRPKLKTEQNYISQ